MARSTKTRAGKAADPGETLPAQDVPDAEIVDAEVVADTSPAARDADDVMSAVQEVADDSPHRADPDEVAEGLPPVSDTADVLSTATVPPVEETIAPVAEVAPEPVPEAVPAPMPGIVPPRAEAPPPPPAPAPVTVRRVGFGPVVLGGIVAAGLGFAAGWQGFLPRPGDGAVDAALSDQAARIEALQASVAAIPAPEPLPDLTPLRDDIAALRAELAPLLDRVAATEARLDLMERAPANDGTLSATAIAAWQQDIEDLKAAVAAQTAAAAAITEAAASRDAELAALQAAMAAQEAEMANMVAAAAQRLDAAESTVAGIEEAATATATATLRRAVLASLQTAVDGGQPYANLLAELSATGIEAPDALAAPATEGLVTQAGLTETFPDAARLALAAARDEGMAADGGNGVMAFLRSQLDVRSVQPREGDDPDAILSRAEAALREARLGDALAEIATLPEVVRAPMTDWVAAAEARMAALAALQSLVEALPVPETSN